MKNILKYAALMTFATLGNHVARGAEKQVLQKEFLELRAIPKRTAEQEVRYTELRDLVAPNLSTKEHYLTIGELTRERNELKAIENRTAEQQERLNYIEKTLAAGYN